MCLTSTPVAQRPTQAQRLVQLLRDIRMAGMVDEMENDFPTLFFEYISAAGLSSRHGMCTDAFGHQGSL